MIDMMEDPQSTKSDHSWYQHVSTTILGDTPHSIHSYIASFFFGMSMRCSSQSCQGIASGESPSWSPWSHLYTLFALLWPLPCHWHTGEMKQTEGWLNKKKTWHQLQPKFKAAYRDISCFEFCTARLLSKIIKSSLPVKTSEVKFQVLGFAICSALFAAACKFRSRPWRLQYGQRQSPFEGSWAPGFWEPSGRPPESTVKSVKDWDVAQTERKRTRIKRMRMVMMVMMMAKLPTATSMFLVTVKSAGLKGHLKSCLFHTTCHIEGNQKPDCHKLLQGRLFSSVFSSRYFITECIIRLKANRRTLRVHLDTHTATHI